MPFLFWLICESWGMASYMMQWERRFYNRLLKQDSYWQLTQWNVPFPWYQFSSVQSLSGVWLFATPRTEACQASLFLTISWILLKLMSFESVIPSHHLILCRPLLFLSSVFPSIKVFSKESVLRISGQSIGASASVLPVNIQGWLPSGLTGLISLQSMNSQESPPAPQFEGISSSVSVFFMVQLSQLCVTTGKTLDGLL